MCEAPNALYIAMPLSLSSSASAAAAESSASSDVRAPASLAMPKDARSLAFFETAVRRHVERDASLRLQQQMQLQQPETGAYQSLSAGAAFNTASDSSRASRVFSSSRELAPGAAISTFAAALHAEFVADEFGAALLPLAASKHVGADSAIALVAAAELLPPSPRDSVSAAAATEDGSPGSAAKLSATRAPRCDNVAST